MGEARRAPSADQIESSASSADRTTDKASYENATN